MSQRDPQNGDRPTPTKALTVHAGREAPVETQLDRIERVTLETWELVGHCARDVTIVKVDLEMTRLELRRVGDSVSLLHGARTSDVPGDPTNRPIPPMRDRLPSSLDLSQVEQLEPAPNGAPRYATTSMQMRQVIATEIAKDREQQRLVEAAAPVLWFKGAMSKGAVAFVVAVCTACGGGAYLAMRLLFGH